MERPINPNAYAAMAALARDIQGLARDREVSRAAMIDLLGDQEERDGIRRLGFSVTIALNEDMLAWLTSLLHQHRSLVLHATLDHTDKPIDIRIDLVNQRGQLEVTYGPKGGKIDGPVTPTEVDKPAELG